MCCEALFSPQSAPFCGDVEQIKRGQIKRLLLHLQHHNDKTTPRPTRGEHDTTHRLSGMWACTAVAVS